jgi:hypothetical protein
MEYVFYHCHPPKTNTLFIAEFSHLLYLVTTKYDRAVILGELNINACCPSNALAGEYFNPLESFNFAICHRAFTQQRSYS